jgi:hypothetical protein
MESMNKKIEMEGDNEGVDRKRMSDFVRKRIEALNSRTPSLRSLTSSTSAPQSQKSEIGKDSTVSSPSIHSQLNQSPLTLNDEITLIASESHIRNDSKDSGNNDDNNDNKTIIGLNDMNSECIDGEPVMTGMMDDLCNMDIYRYI